MSPRLKKIRRALLFKARTLWRKGKLKLPASPRILYVIRRHGGVGGLQRSTQAFVRYFRSSGCLVDIVYDAKAEPGHYSLNMESGLNIYNVRERNFCPALSDYDVLYAHPFNYQQSGMEKIESHFKGIKILNWQKESLSVLKNHRFHFDLLHYELPPAHRLSTAGFVCLPPMETMEPGKVQRPSEKSIPGPYFLTVFNPYGTVKGLRNLTSILDRLDRPLVWCYDLLSFLSDSRFAQEVRDHIVALKHPNLIKVEAPSPAYVQSLYRECSGYICFSQFESFGWSIVDAIRHGCPVAGRKVGILRLVENFLPMTAGSSPSFNRITGDWGSSDFLSCLREQLEGEALPSLPRLEAQLIQV